MLCGPFLMLTCPFWGLLALDRVKHGHPDSAGRQPQIGPHKPVFRYIKWLLMTLSLVPHYSFLEKVIIAVWKDPTRATVLEMF